MVDPAIRRAARMELARREFWSYCKLMAPDFYREDRPYLKELCTRLQAFCESDRKVLVVNMPPRHGKSRTAVLLSQWLFGRDPSEQIMTGSYNETLSTTFARSVRDFKSRIQEIEGIGIERNLAGFPVLYTPPNMNLWDPDDKESQEALSWARDIVTGIKQDSEMGIVLPGGEDGWKLELLHGNTGKAIDTNAVIERYDKRIATTVLADFVMLGQQSVGSFALASSKTKIFALAVGTYLDVICDVFNSQGIPRLIDLNGKAFSQITDYPHMAHGDIEDKDLAVFGEFLQRVSASGILQPDEQIEDYVRRVAGLPNRLETESGTADLSIGRTTEPIQTEQGAVSPGDME